MGMKALTKIWLKEISNTVTATMAYKLGFFLTTIGLILGDILTPLVSVLIYSVSNGIPGWTLPEFILFQGTLILALGLWRTFFLEAIFIIIWRIEQGTFDTVLLKPFPALLTITTDGFDLESIGELIGGLLIVSWAIWKLQLISWLLVPYVILILAGVLFLYSLLVFAGSAAFLFVRSWRLIEFISMVEKFARYPVTIYSITLRFVLTFLVPAAIASYYPATVLIGKEPISTSLLAVIPVVIFFLLSLLTWHYAMKKHTSAGG